MQLDKAYNKDDFKNFLTGFLPDDLSLNEKELVVGDNCKNIKSGLLLGESKSLGVKVFYLEHEKERDPRIALTKEAFKIISDNWAKKALVIFKSRNSENWRLSLMTISFDINEKNKVVSNFSNPRRKSFYLGPDAKIRTPEKYLIKDGKVKDFDDLSKRFSIEVVNKDFYKDIARFFNRLVGGDVKLTSRVEHFEAEMHLPSVDVSDKKTYQEFAVRLIGRIIFCWFLKQKKSENNISLLPDEFLSLQAAKKYSNYYHNVLEKIFFEVLNKPVSQRNRELTNGYGKIPYLNGGLFDPHVDDFYENQSNWALKIPDKWFYDLFEILETYNFTIDENTILDVDLSIDPEMLGRIFENLLAEINPETGQSARKSTGSYYTPRQIVDYMVDQSLIQYLLNKTKIQEKKIRALISVDDSDDEINPLSHEERHKIIDSLNEVKIIDPACGSGAFPMGILQKIVFVLGKIDQNGELWFEKKTENLDSLLKDDFKNKFENENFDYIRKTGIIRDSIYGVDIQPIAVEVSKLRCFLTLVVDEDIDDNTENRGIKPLPNLEFKFVAANTLINLPGSENNGQTGLFEEDIEIKRLIELRDRYFVSNGQNKEIIKYKFKDVQREMFKKQIDKLGQGRMTMALADWDPFSNKSSNWFDPEWMFGIKKFDIVIANPPYVVLGKDYKDLKIYKRLYKAASGGKMNLYKIFIEKAISLLKNGGSLAFINPSNYLSSADSKNLRRFLLEETNLIEIIEYSEKDKIFENVTQALTTMVLVKEKKEENIANLNTKRGGIQKGNQQEFKENKNSEFIFKNRIIEKIAKKEKTLGDFVQGFQGEINVSTKKSFFVNQPIAGYYPVWRGNYIGSYFKLQHPTEYYPSANDTRDHFKLKRIMFQEVSNQAQKKRIKAVIIGENNFCGHTCNYIFSDKLDLKFILSLLNSKLFNYYFSYYNNTNHVPIGEIKSIPFDVDLETYNFKKQVDFVEKILKLIESDDYENNPEKQAEVQGYEKQVDQIVYELYGLTDEEIKIVEGN